MFLPSSSHTERQGSPTPRQWRPASNGSGIAGVRCIHLRRKAYEQKLLMWQTLRHRCLSRPRSKPQGITPAASLYPGQCTPEQTPALSDCLPAPVNREARRGDSRPRRAVLTSAIKRLSRMLVGWVGSWCANSPNYVYTLKEFNANWIIGQKH